MKKIGYLGFFTVLFFILILTFPNIANAKEINPNLPNITDVRYDGLTNFVEIKITKEVYPQFVNFENPSRMVIDFPDTYFLNASKTINVDDEFIKKIKIGQFQNKPPIARVVIEMKKDFRFDITTSTVNEQQTIKLAVEDAQNKMTINNDYLSKRKVKNTIRSIEFDDSLRIVGENFINYELYKSTTPNTYSIKVTDFTVNGIEELPIKNDEIKRIKITELNDDTIFTFQLKQGLKLEAKLLESQKVLQINTSVSNDPIDNTILDTLFLKLEDNKEEKTDKIYLYSNKKSFNYQIFTLTEPNRIVIDTIGAKVSEIDSILGDVNSTFIKKIRAGNLEDVENKTGSRIVLELKKDVLFRENLISENKVLEIEIGERKKFYVAIDAGHGGRDPGAVGQRKLLEKDVALAVAYYLRKKLLDDNIGVLLTRKDDSEVLLKPRVDVANLASTDIFVSIHCNAMVNSGTYGIETYYKTTQSLKLAKVLHETITKKLPTLDRGIRTQPFYVIKHTTMPSVLLEIGYISNLNEESLLATPAYQEKVANAIYDGIKQYMMAKSKI